MYHEICWQFILAVILHWHSIAERGWCFRPNSLVCVFVCLWTQ